MWRYWNEIAEYIDYHRRLAHYRSSNDPLLRRLANGEVGPGYPIETLLEEHPLHRVIRRDEFVTAQFGDPKLMGGVQVIARHGKVLFALDGWCSQAHLFFDVRTPTDFQSYRASQDRLWMEMIERDNAPSHAVAGTGAVAFNNGYYSKSDSP